MEYKVVSIVPIQRQNETAMQVAQDFEGILKKYHAEGWEYMRVDDLQTWVAPVGGCFGFGQTPGYHQVNQMIVFRK